MSTPRCFQPLPPFEAVRFLFGRSRPEALIGFGSRRLTSKGTIAPHCLFVCTAERLPVLWPGISSFEPQRTQYVLQNTLRPAALTNGSLDVYEAAIAAGDPEYFRESNGNVFELANIVVDLDVGRDKCKLTAVDAMDEVVRRCRGEDLPVPSLVGFSGTGLYLVYCLRDAEGLAPVRTPHSKAWWKRAAEALLGRTRDIESDSIASAVANWYKRPGTIDSSTGNRVEYCALREFGTPATYSLEELGKALGVAEVVLPERKRSKRSRTASAASARQNEERSSRSRSCRSGPDPSAPHRKRCAEILRLNEFRSGMPVGCRHFTLRHYYFSRRAELRSANNGVEFFEAKQIAYEETIKLNASFRPPLSHREIHDAIRDFGASAGYRAKNLTVAENLRVTSREAEELGLEMLLPPETVAKQAEAEDVRRAAKLLAHARGVELLRSGAPVKQIARTVGVSPRTVRRWRTELGEPIAGPDRT